jgi:hypothetical protein
MLWRTRFSHEGVDTTRYYGQITIFQVKEFLGHCSKGILTIIRPFIIAKRGLGQVVNRPIMQEVIDKPMQSILGLFG